MGCSQTKNAFKYILKEKIVALACCQLALLLFNLHVLVKG